MYFSTKEEDQQVSTDCCFFRKTQQPLKKPQGPYEEHPYLILGQKRKNRHQMERSQEASLKKIQGSRQKTSLTKYGLKKNNCNRSQKYSSLKTPATQIPSSEIAKNSQPFFQARKQQITSMTSPRSIVIKQNPNSSISLMNPMSQKNKYKQIKLVRNHSPSPPIVYRNIHQPEGNNFYSKLPERYNDINNTIKRSIPKTINGQNYTNRGVKVNFIHENHSYYTQKKYVRSNISVQKSFKGNSVQNNQDIHQKIDKQRQLFIKKMNQNPYYNQNYQEASHKNHNMNEQKSQKIESPVGYWLDKNLQKTLKNPPSRFSEEKRRQIEEKQEIITQKDIEELQQKLENYKKKTIQRAITTKSLQTVGQGQVEKRIEQSVIMIDFFHPSEDQKKKLDPRLALSHAN